MTVFDVERPFFGQIVDIIRLEATVIIHVQKFIFVSHYNSFSIRPTGEFSAFDLFTLQDHRPVMVKSSFSATDHGLYAFLLTYASYIV